ncbi:MAG: squalene--hopene cyclase [Actinomycetia bacterium]|nr:squalene--hopene cyclase [Actinomycetes bacterium]
MLGLDTEKISDHIERSQGYLLSRQDEEGYWIGLLEADVSVVSGFIPLIRFLGIENLGKEKKALAYLLDHQNSDGSWSMFYGGKGSLDVTIQTYFGLKFLGLEPDNGQMSRARKFILDQGGIEAANTYTKIILALFGQYSWKAIPEIPPEIIYLPRWFPINIYDFASWTRSTIMAFSIIIAKKPVHRLSPGQTVFELYRDKNKIKNPDSYSSPHLYSLGNLFLLFNRAFKVWDRLPKKFKIGRQPAIKKVEKWIIERQENDGSWGGIMLPWLFSLIALNIQGYSSSHPVMAKGLKGLDDFIAEGSRHIVLQPATSPVWDTAWAVIGLRDSGIDADAPQILKAEEWLLAKQVTEEGDWKVNNPRTSPGCWSFEFENKYYPDIDDTAIVSMALSLSGKDPDYKQQAVSRGIDWVLDMQNKDGSWAAFDRDNNKRILRDIPFADFITPLDFGSPDITAHVLWVLARLGYTGEIGPIARALRYLKRSQEPDGSWYGRWGVNYIYGSSKVLQATAALGLDNTSSITKNIAKAVDWFIMIQNDDGGWGESCQSYEAGCYQPLGKSTASQTAWALLGLMASRGLCSQVDRGIDYLISSQNEDGSWSEKYYTGGGFPRAFYLKYELYKDYFPLMALAEYRKLKNNK